MDVSEDAGPTSRTVPGETEQRLSQDMKEEKMVASLRFELRSQDPESRMIDRYTTRLLNPRFTYHS